MFVPRAVLFVSTLHAWPRLLAFLVYPKPPLCFQAGRHADAVHAYRGALDAVSAMKCTAPDDVPPVPLSSRLYLQLAKSYIELRHPDWALQVYIQVGWLGGLQNEGG